MDVHLYGGDRVKLDGVGADGLVKIEIGVEKSKLTIEIFTATIDWGNPITRKFVVSNGRIVEKKVEQLRRSE